MVGDKCKTARATRTQPIKELCFWTTAALPALTLPPSPELIHSQQEGSGRDGQMSATIRPPLDICPDRIRLNQSLCVCACARACASHDAKE